MKKNSRPACRFLPLGSTLLAACFLLVLSAGLPCHVFAGEPTDDALALWTFANLEDSRHSDGKASQLTAFGSVKVGVSAENSTENQSSDPKNGSADGSKDGKVARFDGNGWLSAGQGADGELNLNGSELTFYVRLKPGPIASSYPIFSKHGGHSSMAFNLFAFPDFIGTEIGTTGNGYEQKSESGQTAFIRRPLSGRARFDEMRGPATAASRWHDVIVRVNEAKMELFVDGRCVDEDFVLGELNQNSVPLLFGAQDCGNGAAPDPAHPENFHGGFVGEMDLAAVWNRSLSDDEILTLSGGPEKADLRLRTDRGNGENLQYWCPPNAYGVGDCMPFFQDGIFHFLYLLDRGHHSSKNGKGAHQWIQATSRDLIHWEHQPFVVPITRQNEGSICTGCVFFHDGVYHAFYANRSLDRGGILETSVSRDGIHFEKQSGPLVLMPEGYAGSLRDPEVFTSPEDGLFHLLATTSYRGRGCWAHLVSSDLKTWELRDPIYLRTDASEPECPNWFQIGNRYYSITQHEYRIADSPLGPWRKPTANSNLMPGIVRVPKSAPFGGNRRIVVGWTSQRGFGGDVIFHEIVPLPDGQLGTRFVPEMLPPTNAPVLEVRDLALREKSWEGVLPRELRLELELTFDPAKADSLLEFTVQAGSGKTMTIHPAARLVQVDGGVIEDVDFSTGRLTLDVFVKRDLCDVCVQGTHCFTTTIPVEDVRTLTCRDASELLDGSFTLNAESSPKRESFRFQPGFTIRSLRVSPLAAEPKQAK